VKAEAAFWADIRNVRRATEARTQAQGPGLSRVAAAGVGAAVGAGSGVTGAVAGSYIVPKIQQAITSPRWRLVDAHLKNKLAEAMANGDEQQIAGALGRVMAAITSTSGGER
jgi:hypothetical protein